jgi:hypothetical protein
MMCRIPKFYSKRQHGNLQIWVVRAMIDVHVYKNVKYRSASVKQRSGYVHQNVTEAVHATISNNKIKKMIIFSNNMSLFIKSYHPNVYFARNIYNIHIFQTWILFLYYIRVRLWILLIKTALEKRSAFKRIMYLTYAEGFFFLTRWPYSEVFLFSAFQKTTENSVSLSC